MNAIICPVRSGLDMTREAVDSFLRQDIGEVHVVMVDNSGGVIGQQFDTKVFPMTIMKPPQPAGVAQSWNAAIRFYFNGSKADHILVCNNDIVLRPDTYRWLLADGGGFVTGVSDLSRDCLNSDIRPHDRRPHPDFSCFLIRRWVWDRVGEFDETFIGAYCEDNDYHLRMNACEVDSYCLGIPVYHRVSGTIKSLPPHEAEAIHRQAHANRMRFKEKWGCLPGDDRYYEYFKKVATA